jgi:hypothetical protein
MATTAGALLGSGYALPDEEGRARSTETYRELVARLSRQSVAKHFDAYADIRWDEPEFRIDPEDARWELSPNGTLGGTAWYRAQPPGARARIGLHIVATFMRIGVQFESVLKRGLLDFATTLPGDAPELRYVYHEVIEEAQHSLMFQEFVNRSGFEVPGLPPLLRLATRQVIRFARTFPELFFVFVLGGEDPIDHVQREALRNEQPVHPLLRRIMQIHVTEEARHLCFARHYLREHVPRLGSVRRAALALRAPIILAIMAQLMMRPSGEIIRTYGIPAPVVAEAYGRNPRHRAQTIEAIAKVRGLCCELGIAWPWLWARLGIWDAEPVRAR